MRDSLLAAPEFVRSESSGRRACHSLPAKLAVSRYLLNDLFVSKVEQVEDELRKLSQEELRQIREWLDDVIERRTAIYARVRELHSTIGTRHGQREKCPRA